MAQYPERDWQEGLSTLGHDNAAAQAEANQTAARQAQPPTQQPYATPGIQPAPSVMPQPEPTAAPYAASSPPPTAATDLESILAATKRKLAIIATVAIVLIAVSIVGFLVLSGIL